MKIIEIMHSARAITEKKIHLVSPKLGKSLRIKTKGQRQSSNNPKGLIKTPKHDERHTERRAAMQSAGTRAAQKPVKQKVQRTATSLSGRVKEENEHVHSTHGDHQMSSQGSKDGANKHDENEENNAKEISNDENSLAQINKAEGESSSEVSQSQIGSLVSYTINYMEKKSHKAY